MPRNSAVRKEQLEKNTMSTMKGRWFDDFLSKPGHCSLTRSISLLADSSLGDAIINVDCCADRSY